MKYLLQLEHHVEPLAPGAWTEFKEVPQNFIEVF